MEKSNSGSMLEETEVPVMIARAMPKYKISFIVFRSVDFVLSKHLFFLIFLISKTLLSLKKYFDPK